MMGRGDLTLYLLRHGETSMTLEGRFCGSSDPDLTDRGAEMAEAVAAAYKGVKWSGIYTSPLTRVLQTIAPLVRECAVDAVPEEGLKEIDYGLWEGRVVREMEQEEPEVYRFWAEEPGGRGTPGGENVYQVAGRAMRTIEGIRQRHVHGGNVLVASHKATIRILLCCFLGIDARRYRDRLACPVTSVSKVRFTALGPMVELLGDISHLSPSLREQTKKN